MMGRDPRAETYYVGRGGEKNESMTDPCGKRAQIDEICEQLGSKIAENERQFSRLVDVLTGEVARKEHTEQRDEPAPPETIVEVLAQAVKLVAERNEDMEQLVGELRSVVGRIKVI